VPTPVQLLPTNEKKDELLFNVDDEEPIDHMHNTSARILEDLNDLTFENKTEVNLIQTELEGESILF